ncbi:LOW QUALITY PROTEIN: hypothetical protein OSB04_004032 [Centaurea solstitialis]|uniref:Uncharacterized protein n=1 Tax=Centaurea solstitialis TaxID=347529 RepID=A0AA38U8G6_9ASTR|nr:LOW QUALITY PROTEIN: hypothetical protein OSB04_004032 [Centaurea solstitialis]
MFFLVVLMLLEWLSCFWSSLWILFMLSLYKNNKCKCWRLLLLNKTGGLLCTSCYVAPASFPRHFILISHVDMLDGHDCCRKHCYARGFIDQNSNTKYVNYDDLWGMLIFFIANMGLSTIIFYAARYHIS